MNNIIEKWKNDPSVERFEDEEGNTYGIRIIGPGVNLFFQENQNGLICNIDAIKSIFYAGSVNMWNDREKMNKAEKQRVVKLIEHYYKNCFNTDVTTSPKYNP